ncbi:MAG: hypothetical protein LCI03_03335 [Actinobacteria bacterium]|nr:hypothetical protein [Actinomycetota bacterium]
MARLRLRAPSEIRARVPGEKVLAWCPSGSSSCIATGTGLLLPEGFDPARLAWDLVLRAVWGEDGVDITAQRTPGGRPETFHVPMSDDAESLAMVTRERVNASIVVQHHAELVGSAGARLVARRIPGSTDLRWSVVFDPGLDPSDPDLRAAADQALADLRTSLGI